MGLLMEARLDPDAYILGLGEWKGNLHRKEAHKMFEGQP